MPDEPNISPAAPTDPWQMTPEQASAALAVLKTQYDAQNASPTSPAGQRLQAIFSDEKLKNSYLSGGSVAIQREVAALHEQMLAAGDQPSEIFETVDAVSDPSALSRREYASAMDGLREQGLPADAESYMRELDAGVPLARPTAGDGIAARQALDRLMKDPEFGRKCLSGDLSANDLLGKLNRVIAYAADDGQPVSDVVAQGLAARGLR